MSHNPSTPAMGYSQASMSDNAPTPKLSAIRITHAKIVEERMRDDPFWGMPRKPQQDYIWSAEDIRAHNDNNAWIRSLRSNICCAHLAPRVACACTTCEAEEEKLHQMQAQFWADLKH